jgi:hypothetical protein
LPVSHPPLNSYAVTENIYDPNFAKPVEGEQISTLDPSIAARGELTIGYGAGGANRQGFKISDDDLDVEVTYLKVFITTSPVDLSYIAQESPFPSFRKGITQTDPPKDIWNTLTMAIIAKRGFND